MRIGDEEVTREQIFAGMSAMCAEFRASDVRAALARAGVRNTDRAADRLMQFERKAGRIKPSPHNKRKWVSLTPPKRECRR